MSQPLQLSGLNALLGQGAKGEASPGQLGELLQAMELEGKTFSELLDSEFAQLLDEEQLQTLQDNPEILEDLKDDILPLIALLGGKELPVHQDGITRMPLETLQANEGLIKSIQVLSANAKEGKALGQADMDLNKLTGMLSTDGAAESESSEEFLKQLQILTSNRQQSMAINQQAVQQVGAEPVTNTVGLTTLQNASQHPLQPVPVTQTVQTPPGQPGWDTQIGQRLIFMVSNEMKSAEIRLNPADLGPMEVKVKTEGEKVSVVINVQNPQVREAIEQSLPRLREIFSGQGMDLGDVDVGQHGFAQDQERNEAAQFDHHAEAYGNDRGVEETEEQQITVSSSHGMVDVYI